MTKRFFPYIILMLVSPAFGLFQAFRDSSRSIKRWALIVFITFFGSVIMLGVTSDGYHHWHTVYDHYTDLSVSQFLSELGNMLLLKRNTTGIEEEPYIHFLSFFIGRILGMPGLFFVFVSFIYAYFFSGSLFRLFEIFPKPSYSKMFFIFALVFLLWRSLEGIGTVRTWTGLWVLFYACISYAQTKKKKYLILMLVPPFIHIGFGLMAIPAWLVTVLGVRKWPYIVLFVISFSTTVVNPPTVTGVLEQTEVGAAKVAGYYVDAQWTMDQTLEHHMNHAWYLKLYALGIQDWAVVAIALAFIVFGAYFNGMTKAEEYIFSVGLLTKTLSNSTWFLFALSNRSGILSGVFILAVLLLMWQRGYFLQKTRKVKFQKKILIVAAIALIPFIIYKVADLIYYTSVFLFFAPFIPWLDTGVNISIRKAIGALF